MNKARMSVAALLCVLVVLCAGCPGEKRGSDEEFKKKSAEAGSQKELADFFLKEESYAEARKHYEETARTAHIALSYCRDDEGMSRLIKEAETKLESEEIVEGCQGKIVVKGKWEKPDEYLAERVRVISASPDYEKTSAALKKEFETLLEVVGNAPERALQTDSGKKIIAEGMKALPVLLEKVNTEDFYSETAAHLALNIPDADDTILCFLLTGLKSRNLHVRKACASSAWKFPRKVTTVALAEGLSHISPEVCEALVASIIKLNEPLGWHVFRETLLGPRGSPELKQTILASLYLYGDERAIDALVKAVQMDDPLLVLAAASSLLKMDSEKIPPALATVLKRAKDLTSRTYQNEELFTAVIEKLGEVRYADAVDALADVFREPSFPMATREAALDALARIGNEAAVERLSEMVHRRDDEHDKLWMTVADKLADAVKRLKNKDILDKFIKDTESSHSEVVARAAYVLGLFEDEVALPHLRKAFHRVENKKTRSAILNALARIGNNAAIGEILLIFKTGDIHEIVGNYVDGIQENIQHGPAFYALFKGLEDCPQTVTRQVFESVRANAPPLALEALFLIAADKNSPFELRFGAISALSSYVEQMTENQKGNLRNSIVVSLALLQNERDPDLFIELAYEALKYHKDRRLLLLYVEVLKQSDNWLMRYLAAQCLLAIKPEISHTIQREIAGEYLQLRESKDYCIAELLAGFTSNQDEEIAEIRNSRNKEIAELGNTDRHPLKGRLGQPLSGILELELLGKNYTEISPPQSASEDNRPSQKPKFLHFTDDAILLMTSKGSQEEEKATAAVYLPDFKGKLYGIYVGQNIGSVIRLVDLGNPEQIRYLPEYGAYVITINPRTEGDPKKSLSKMLVLPLEETGNGGAVIRYMVEILSQAGEEQELETLVKVIGELVSKRPGPETVP